MANNPELDNAAIRQMRSEIERVTQLSATKDTELAELRAKLEEATTQLTAQERARLDELERTKLELEDAKKQAEANANAAKEAEQLAGVINSTIEARITALPEANQQTIRDLLSTTSSPAARLEQLDKLIKLGGLDRPIDSGTPIRPGTPVASGAIGPNGQPEGTIKYDPKNLPGWGEVLGAPERK